MTSLEGWSSTIELRPQQPPRYGAAVPVAYRPRRLLRAQATSAGAKATVTPGWHSERNSRPGGDEQQMPENAQAQIGVTGLGVMGRNLARNFARHGYTVALHNRTASRVTDIVDQFGHEGTFVATQTAQDFVQALERPRRLLIMVNAGEATDAVINEFAPLLEPGDMLIDGGKEGALLGPSIMPGGSTESYRALGPMLETISAHVDGTPCCTHIGPDGAGHFVKMVHNGIEYADMQLIAEAYDLLRHAIGLTPVQAAQTFRTWNTGRLNSYLIEITAEVLAHTDAATGQPFVD